MNILEVKGITKSINGTTVVSDISFTVPSFLKLAIAGETGSGKSTLLKMIAGFIQPDKGEVVLEGKHVDGPLEKLVAGHSQIAFLSQQFELRNNYRVEELLEYANTFSEADATVLFQVCQIDHLLKRRTDQLSGGEKQRIAIARLLISSPKLLLLDEPFSNLDMIHKRILKAVIHNISEKVKITTILVSHDPSDTLPWADEMLVMRQGAIIQQGSPVQVYTQPVNEYTAGLLGNYTLVSQKEASILGIPANVTAGKNKVLIRPEYFTVSKKKIGSVQGEIVHIGFLGSAYELKIICHGITVTAITTEAGFQVGGNVYISVPADNIWLLPSHESL